MPIMPRRRLDEKAAHRSVTLDNANATQIEWPVSGDETLRRYGMDSRKDSVDLWRAPGVVPRSKTEGIRVGSRVTTWHGTGVVTRVGSTAGFYILEGQSKESRWDIESVEEIHAQA